MPGGLIAGELCILLGPDERAVFEADGEWNGAELATVNLLDNEMKVRSVEKQELHDSAMICPAFTCVPGNTRTLSSVRWAYSAMVPSACRMRTALARAPYLTMSEPLPTKSRFTSITRPPRAARMGVPSGMAMSTAYSLSGVLWLNSPKNAWVTSKALPPG